jgi:hypothetical protein
VQCYFANCYQNEPKNARKEAKEGREGENNHNRKEEGNCAEI